jgi:hypothetical protein
MQIRPKRFDFLEEGVSPHTLACWDTYENVNGVTGMQVTLRCPKRAEGHWAIHV